MRKMNSTPELSILIPSYEMKGKGSEMLSFSLNRLREQTFKNFDIVISDDSKDEVIRDYVFSIQDLNIKYVKNLGNRGIAGNTNNAIKFATGKILQIMCQDDYFYDENSLQRITDSFNINDGWMVSSYMHTENRIDIFKQQLPTWNDHIYLYNTIGTPSCLSFTNNDPIYFDENLTWFVDCEYYYRLYKRYGIPRVLNNINFVQYLWEGQTTNSIITQEIVAKEENYIRNKYIGEIE
jgi:glycosyltransferase involved in cell wall biosynthesis